MRGRWVLLLVIVFAAGVCLGIWLNAKLDIGGRQIVFQVQDYQRANLKVFPGDTVSLVNPDGDPSDVQFGFVGGLSPCKDPTNKVKCEVDKKAPLGPYFFTCAGGTYTCPDPALQQSQTTPIGVMLGFDGGKKQKKQKQSESNVANAVRGLVACDTSASPNVTEVLNPENGKSSNPLPASSGDSVFWISSVPFTMDTSQFPANFCSNGNPSGTYAYPKEAECDIPKDYGGSTTLPYTVQSQTTPTACPALPAQLKVN